MSPEFPTDPRQALEASLTALILGELPPDQSQFLREALIRDAELARMHQRLKQTIELVRQVESKPAAVPAPAPAPLRLREEKREKLLEHFKTAPLPELEEATRGRNSWWLVAAAALVVGFIGLSMVLPAMSRAKSKGTLLSLNSRSSVPSAAFEARPLERFKTPEARTELPALEMRRAERLVDAEIPKRADEVAGGVNAVPSSEKPKANIVLPTSASLRGYYDDNQEAAQRSPTIRGLAEGDMGGVPPAVPVAGIALKTEPPPQSVPLVVADSSAVAFAVPAATPPPPAITTADANAPERRSLEPASPAFRGGFSMLGPSGGIGGGGGGVGGSVAQAQSTDSARKSEEAAPAAKFARRYRLTVTPQPQAGDSMVTLGTAVDPSTGLPVSREKASEAEAKLDGIAGRSAGLAAGQSQTEVVRNLGRLEVQKDFWGDYDKDGAVDMLAEADSAKVPVLGDQPAVGRPLFGGSREATANKRAEVDMLYSSSSALEFNPQKGVPKGLDQVKNGIVLPAEDGRKQVVESPAMLLSDQANEKVAALVKEAAEAKKVAARPSGSSNVHNLNVVGYVNVPAEAAGRYSLAVTNGIYGTAGKPESGEALGKPLYLAKGKSTNFYFGEELKQRSEDRLGAQGSGVHSVDSAAIPSYKAKGAETTPAQRAREDLAPAKPAVPPPVPQPEISAAENAFSTFSLNVSDVSFKLAAASLEKGVFPEAAGIRSEEFINAFDYRDPEPSPGMPLAFAWERARYPFAQNRDLLRLSIKTAAQGRQTGRPLNLVLLVDNSGSMERADRVLILRESLRVLATQLQQQDKLSVVTFARTPSLRFDGVSGSEAGRVAEEVAGLTPQGGTNLEEAMKLAYQTAARHYLAEGINRVVVLTDGAANLGDVNPEDLKKSVEAHRKQGIALDCFGIGWEGYNDDLLEVLSRNGDGRYGFINTPEEASTEFAGQLAGALRVAASDVKVQVEFNPTRVTVYRQIGYAKHQLTKEQFRDNTVDAAEIGAAESGNALYVVEVNPQGEGPLAVVRVRYKVPATADYHEHEWTVPYAGNAPALEQASPAMRLATAASAFSEWLATSPYAASVAPGALVTLLRGVPQMYGADVRPQKLEWMIRQANSLAGK